MIVTRRTFVTASAALSTRWARSGQALSTRWARSGQAVAVIGSARADADTQGRGGGTPPPASILALKPLPNPAPPITDDERRARVAKAQRLMIDQGIDAIVLEGGTSLSYFLNVRWGLSERPFLLVIPAKGDVAYVSPGFEEQRAREVIKFSNDVSVWQEDEDPLRLVAGILKDRGVSTAKVGVEERVRFFTPSGPTFFTQPSPAIDRPFAQPESPIAV